MNYLNKLFLLLILLSTIFSFGQIDDHYIIASGSQGGNYIKVGSYIASQYNSNIDSKFTSIETEGSLDNIDLLKNNFADFAIVQRNVLLNSLYDESNGINNVEVIAPLFEEKLLIYSKSDKPLNINSLKEILLHKKKTIGFTSKTGYTYKLFCISVNSPNSCIFT